MTFQRKVFEWCSPVCCITKAKLSESERELLRLIGDSPFIKGCSDTGRIGYIKILKGEKVGHASAMEQGEMTNISVGEFGAHDAWNFAGHFVPILK